MGAQQPRVRASPIHLKWPALFGARVLPVVRSALVLARRAAAAAPGYISATSRSWTLLRSRHEVSRVRARCYFPVTSLVCPGYATSVVPLLSCVVRVGLLLLLVQCSADAVQCWCACDLWERLHGVCAALTLTRVSCLLVALFDVSVVRLLARSSTVKQAASRRYGRPPVSFLPAHISTASLQDMAHATHAWDVVFSPSFSRACFKQTSDEHGVADACICSPWSMWDACKRRLAWHAGSRWAARGAANSRLERGAAGQEPTRSAGSLVRIGGGLGPERRGGTLWVARNVGTHGVDGTKWFARCVSCGLAARRWTCFSGRLAGSRKR